MNGGHGMKSALGREMERRGSNLLPPPVSLDTLIDRAEESGRKAPQVLDVEFTSKETPADEVKQGAIGLSPRLGSFLMMGTPNHARTASAALQIYRQSSAVAIPVRKITEAFKVLRPVLFDMKEMKTVEDSDAFDALERIRRPGPRFDQRLALESYARHFLLTGEAFPFAAGEIDRPPVEVQPISPANVTHLIGENGDVSQFEVTGLTWAGRYSLVRDLKSARGRYIGPPSVGNRSLSEIAQIRNWSSEENSMIRGESPLMSMAKEATQNILGGEHNVQLLKSGGRISLVFHYKGERMRGEIYEETVDRVRSQFGGSDNAGQIAITSGEDLDIKEMSRSPKDLDFANLQGMSKQAFALNYNVPLPLVSLDASTFSNMADSRLGLHDDAVDPLAVVIFGGLSDLLLPRYDFDPLRYVYTYDLDAIPALRTRRLEELEKRRKIGIESVNETRKSQPGLDPLTGDEEGPDAVYQPGTMVPIGKSIMQSDDDPFDEDPIDAEADE